MRSNRIDSISHANLTLFVMVWLDSLSISLIDLSFISKLEFYLKERNFNVGAADALVETISVVLYNLIILTLFRAKSTLRLFPNFFAQSNCVCVRCFTALN